MQTIKNELVDDVNEMARKLTSSAYLTTRHVEQLIMEACSLANRFPPERRWLVYLAFLNGVFERGTRQQSPLFKRRFTYFSTGIATEFVTLFPSLEKEKKARCLRTLLHLLREQAAKSDAPWPDLLMQLARFLDKRELEDAFTFLSTSIDENAASLRVILAWSYIGLRADREVAAHVILQKQAPYAGEQLRFHFQLFKERERWETMKHWVDTLLSDDGTTALAPFIDEMNAVLAKDERHRQQIWERWLYNPSFSRFLTLTRDLDEGERLRVFLNLQEKLEERLHDNKTKTTYVQLLVHFRQFERLTDFFTLYEYDDAKYREALNTLQKEAPDYLKRVYHQWIVRLIAKKTRLHYREAVDFIQKLKTLYDRTDESDRFRQYVAQLQRHYRTYRAFLEELKRVET